MDEISKVNKQIEKSWKFFIPKENNWKYIKQNNNTTENIIDFYKENKFLKLKNQKIINFFEITEEDLELPTEDFQKKVSYILNNNNNFYDIIKK